MRTKAPRLAFNRGLISPLGLARADIKRVAMSAEIQTNWVPRVLGSMSLRPGLGYLGNSSGNLAARYVPGIFSISQKWLLEFTNLAMRVWVNDALLTRGSVSSAVANGNFDSNLTSWTDNDEAGGTSAWVAGGYMGLTGNGTAAAIRDQQVTVAAADQNDEHALRIVVQRGPVILRVGSTAGGDEYITETTLETGYHSLTFTPTGNFHIRFMSRLKRQVLVDSCNVEAAGVVSLTSPYATADLGKIRFDQSGDVIFLAAGKTTDDIGYPQYMVERRNSTSFSLVRYLPEDGPFMVINTTPITMTPGALSGNTTLTASASYFKSTNVGSLFKVFSDGQAVSATITAEDQFTNAIRVENVDNARIFSITVDEDAAGAATFTLQRSLVSDQGPWTDVESYTADTSKSFDDGLDNQIAWYRLGVKTGNYVNGTHSVSLNYTVGSITGICRVTGYTSPTVVDVEVIVDFGGTAASDEWHEGQWSDRRGFPTCVRFHEGRLTWHGRDKSVASISDAFFSFDDEQEGDAGPINRSIGSGPVDTIEWALSLQRLMLGGQGAEFSVRSSSLDEPLTPTNWNLKSPSDEGSASVDAVKVNDSGILVQRGGTRIYQLAWGDSGVDYEASHLSALIPEIGQPGITRIAVQRQPDTRVHFVRSDGTVAMLIFDRVEQVICFIEIETDGTIEDVVVLPGNSGEEEDWVYYSVARSINGATVRFLEKWARESQCVGGTINRQADAFVTYSQSASTTISGLTHLIGESVVVWDNGVCLADASGNIATFTVNGSGQITGLTHRGESRSCTQGVVGLPYTASWKSSRMVEVMENPDGSLLDTATIKEVGLLLAHVHAKGLKYGFSLTESEMRDLPVIHEGAAVDLDTVHTSLDPDPLGMPNGWDNDTRICLLAKAPRPATVLCAIGKVDHHG